MCVCVCVYIHILSWKNLNECFDGHNTFFFRFFSITGRNSPEAKPRSSFSGFGWQWTQHTLGVAMVQMLVWTEVHLFHGSDTSPEDDTIERQDLEHSLHLSPARWRWGRHITSTSLKDGEEDKGSSLLVLDIMVRLCWAEGYQSPRLALCAQLKSTSRPRIQQVLGKDADKIDSVGWFGFQEPMVLKHHPAAFWGWCWVGTQRNHRQTVRSILPWPSTATRREKTSSLRPRQETQKQLPMSLLSKLLGTYSQPRANQPPAADSTWGAVLWSHPSCKGRSLLLKQMLMVPGELLSWQLPPMLGEVCFLEPEKEKSTLKLPPNTQSDTDTWAARCVCPQATWVGVCFCVCSLPPVRDHCGPGSPSSSKPGPFHAFSIQLPPNLPQRNRSSYSIISQTSIESLLCKNSGSLALGSILLTCLQ